MVFGGLLLALGDIATGIVLLGGSWLQLLMAGALGVVLTHFAFLGHEASHRQVLGTETTLVVAYRSVPAHLHRVGLHARDSFDCLGGGVVGRRPGSLRRTRF